MSPVMAGEMTRHRHVVIEINNPENHTIPVMAGSRDKGHE
jgi:hypothetical protein